MLDNFFPVTGSVPWSLYTIVYYQTIVPYSAEVLTDRRKGMMASNSNTVPSIVATGVSNGLRVSAQQSNGSLAKLAVGRFDLAPTEPE